MNSKVFFSYSHRDKKIAQKIYWDFINSGISVWRDQINGEPCANFREEFLKKIEECDIFLVLDSENYRSNSSWCLLEIEKYFSKQSDSKRMFVGLLQTPGQWRDTYRNEREDKYFHKLNEQIYIELFSNGIYDNDAQYAQGMDKLIKYIGGTYLPWHQIPEEKDLLDELANIDSSYKITDNERDSILEDFRIIRQRDLQGAPTVDARINLWIQDCEFMQQFLVFPYLYAAIHYLNQNKFDVAAGYFRKIMKYHETDPRGYRGLGLCEGNLGNYISAKKQYDVALQTSFNIGGKHLEYIWEILTNRASVLMEIQDFHNAEKDLLEVLRISEIHGLYVIKTMLNLEFCYYKLGMPISKRIQILQKALSINPLEEEVYIRLGNCYNEIENWCEALNQYKMAYDLVNSPRNVFALIQCYLNVGYQKEIENVLHSISEEDLLTDEDFYYYGFSQYLQGNKSQAKEYYNKCKNNSWIWYGKHK